MDINNNIVLLLTSCVTPNGMSYVALNDANIRLQQYLLAIKYYLEHTIYKIVVVDNSNFDFSAYFNTEIENNRIEFFAFEGNNYNKKLGKGYGEASIIKYGLDNSNFISKNSIVAKVTGRVILSNINELINFFFRKKDTQNIVYADMNLNMKFMGSVFFIAPTYFFEDFFVPKCNKINDSKGIYIEHVLLEATKEWIQTDGHRFLPIRTPINIWGYSGTNGKKVKEKKGIVIRLKTILKYIIIVFYLQKKRSKFSKNK